MIIKWVSITILFSTLIAAIILGLNQKHDAKVPAEINQTPHRNQTVYVGAWVGGFWDNDTKQLNASAAANFQEAIGKKLAITNIFSEWTYLAKPALLDNLYEISDNGWTPMISANPSFFKECSSTGENLYKTIASGNCDKFLKEAGDNLRSFDKPVFFRFAWEMNLPNMYWSTEKTNSTPEDFVSAWKHFHDIMKLEGADNVIWVLSFNTSNANTVPYAQLYPGDEYVDWVAIDGYNWGNSHDWSRWTNFNGVFINSYKELLEITDKPVMLSEVNSAPDEHGGDKAEWLKDMLDVQIPTNYPSVRAIIFFNEDKTEGEKMDWRMEASPEYLSTLKKSLSNTMYKSDYQKSN